MAPMKRAAWTQSLTGLPLSRIAEAIMATAHAIAQRISVLNRFADELVIRNSPMPVMTFRVDVILSSKREIASQFNLKTI